MSCRKCGVDSFSDDSKNADAVVCIKWNYDVMKRETIATRVPSKSNSATWNKDGVNRTDDPMASDKILLG